MPISWKNSWEESWSSSDSRKDCNCSGNSWENCSSDLLGDQDRRSLKNCWENRRSCEDCWGSKANDSICKRINSCKSGSGKNYWDSKGGWEDKIG